jgi:hypothetical protein
MDAHFRVRRREPFEILAVPRQNAGSSRFYGMGYD